MKKTINESFKESLKRTMSPIGIISFVVLVCYSISLLIPLGWSFITSCRDYEDIMINGGASMPDPWVNNYRTVFEYFRVKIAYNGEFRYVEIPEMLLNSIVYSIGGSIISMLTSLCVAYICAKFDFKFCKWIYAIVIFQMIIPIVGSLPSELRIARFLHLYDKLFGLIAMKTYVTGLYFLVFYSSFKLIPKDFKEAAEIDGASNFKIMTRIMFPFVAGTIFTVILLNFIGLWNDYQTPLIYMPSKPTIAYGLYHFVNGSYEVETSNLPMKLAGCMVVAIPLFVLFLGFQKRLLGNLSMGGLK